MSSRSVVAPGCTERRSEPSGNVPMSTAERSSSVSVGVGACTTLSTSAGSAPTRPSLSTGTAQVSDHAVRSRSSVGRSESNRGSNSPERDRVRQWVTRVPSPLWWVVTRSVPAASSPSERVSRRSVPSTTTHTSDRPSKASSSASPVRSSSSRTRWRARSSRSTRVTTVSKSPSGRSGSRSAGKGSLSIGTCPERRPTSSARSAWVPSASSRSVTTARARSAEKCTAPDPESTMTLSLSAATAENPTPNRPTEPSSPRLLEARRVARDSTPSAVR